MSKLKWVLRTPYTSNLTTFKLPRLWTSHATKRRGYGFRGNRCLWKLVGQGFIKGLHLVRLTLDLPHQPRLQTSPYWFYICFLVAACWQEMLRQMAIDMCLPFSWLNMMHTRDASALVVWRFLNRSCKAQHYGVMLCIAVKPQKLTTSQLSSSPPTLSNLRPRTSTNWGSTERGDALPTMVGKQSLRWWKDPRISVKAMKREGDSTMVQTPSSLKLMTPAALTPGAEVGPEVPAEDALPRPSKRTSSGALMSGVSESSKLPVGSCMAKKMTKDIFPTWSSWSGNLQKISELMKGTLQTFGCLKLRYCFFSGASPWCWLWEVEAIGLKQTEIPW